MGLKEDLLAKILQRMSPCPKVCENQPPYGTGVYDIKTGLEFKKPITTPTQEIINPILIGGDTYLEVGDNEYLMFT